MATAWYHRTVPGRAAHGREEKTCERCGRIGVKGLRRRPRRDHRR